MKTRFILPVLFLISFSLGSFTSCKEPSSGPENEVKDSLVLTFKESDITSATLSLHTSGVTLPASVSLYRNGDSVQAFLLHRADTTLKDSLLSPSTSYNWQTKLRKTASSFLSSNTVTARTMDTTSHTFTWKLDTLGAAGSVLFDVAIVNDTCVWVVGDIKSQPYSPVDRYNAAMWNGKAWKKFRILMLNGVGTLSVQILNTLYYVNSKLFLSSGSSLSTMDLTGKVSKRDYYRAFNSGATKKIFGLSDNDIYLVGDFGSITHYNGSTFTLMESGTTVNLQDVWGTSDNEVWACGWSQTSSTVESVLLRFNGNSWETFENSPLGPPIPPDNQVRDYISSVWMNKNSDSVLVSSTWGVFLRGKTQSSKARRWLTTKFDFPSDPNGRIQRIRGTGKANIFAFGEFGAAFHFNGSTWHRFYELVSWNRHYYSAACGYNLVCAVGEDLNSAKAIVTISKQIQEMK